MDGKFVVAKEYIHKKSIGNEAEIRTKGYLIIDFLENQLEKKSIEGFEVFFINREEKARKKLIFSNYKKETNNIYPFLYIAIQFKDTNRDTELESFIKENHCVPIYLE